MLTSENGRVSISMWKRTLLRSAGFGAGFAIATIILVGAFFWRSERPKEWNGKAITAKPTELRVQQKGEELHISFRYALTNNTKVEYDIPASGPGELMRKIPNYGSLEKMEDSTWDSTIRIPPKQSLNVVFETTYKFEDYDTTAAQLNGKLPNDSEEISPELLKFINRRLSDIDGLVFLDYNAKYKIDLPKDWNNLK